MWVQIVKRKIRNSHHVFLPEVLENPISDNGRNSITRATGFVGVAPATQELSTLTGNESLHFAVNDLRIPVAETWRARCRLEKRALFAFLAWGAFYLFEPRWPNVIFWIIIGILSARMLIVLMRVLVRFCQHLIFPVPMDHGNDLR